MYADVYVSIPEKDSVSLEELCNITALAVLGQLQRLVGLWAMYRQMISEIKMVNFKLSNEM